MARPYKKSQGLRVPAAVGNLQLNRCHNAACPNFAVLPREGPNRWADADSKDGYISIAATGQAGGWKNVFMQCRSCRESIGLLNNATVVEECDRLRPPSVNPSSDACRGPTCENQNRSVAAYPSKYQRFGRSEAGSQRHRCRRCGSTFSIRATATHRLRRPEKTEQILKLLVNKVPMRRLCEVAGIGPQLLYQRISRLAAQCRSFSAHHEALFLPAAEFKQLHLCVDRQDHDLNWGSALDRRSTTLRAIASADSRTGYIVSQHLNYDPAANPMALELLAREVGDPEVKLAFRQYGRVWLPYEAATASLSGKATEEKMLPGKGAIVHESYSMAAHILGLSDWMKRAEYVQFSLDREPGLGRICTLVDPERVRAGTLDVFFVRIDKEMTVAQRQQSLARAEAALSELRQLHPNFEDAQLVRRVVLERYERVRCTDGLRRAGWVAHPYPSMGEPEREVQCATDDGRRDVGPIVAGIARASLRAIDRYFMQVRRKINILERPLRTSSAAGRAWYGYTAYSARVVAEVLDIFRTVYNCHLQGQDRRTPAQRMGVLTHRVTLAELCAWPM